MDEIDKFVAYLIAEECEGCTYCEPRLEGFREGVCCVSQGRVSWFLAKAGEYKKARANNEQEERRNKRKTD